MGNQPRILICDDEPMMTRSLEAVLKTQDYWIRTTNHSKQALELIRTDAPDVVILDVNMPEMTGFEIIDAVDSKQNDPAFILITGDASVETAIQAIRKGASDYLRKPFEPDELILRVEKVLQQRQIVTDNKRIEAEKDRLQGQLRQSQKMEAIGTLAGGIAHDFNNILSIILGNSELALLNETIDQELRDQLDQILTASLRARGMIQQLLSFSRDEKPICKPLNFNSVIEESLKLLRSSLPTNIVIDCDIGDDPCTIYCDATQLHQVILNLCTNAAYAMEPDGGVLTVRLKPVMAIKSVMATETGDIGPGNYARLIVADNGKGIEKHILERIFDPYFTTKEVGKGTGMGLSVVHGIVQRSGGGIQVFSQPGKYTKFHVYLPLDNMQLQVTKEEAPLPRKRMVGGQERILIVDDEEMLANMMRKVVEVLGYKARAFNSSGKALKAFLEAPQDVDLVITDMTMPIMTGTTLAKAIKRVRKDLPIILCTGYNEQACNMDLDTFTVNALIMKPVGIQKIAETIRGVLAPRAIHRRMDKRVIASAGIFVISDTHPYERCTLVDIGHGGLAYCHELKGGVSVEDDLLSIMTPDGDIFIADLPCKIVSDLPEGNDLPLPQPGQARRSVRFFNLSPHQKKLIGQFMQRYAIEVAN